MMRVRFHERDMSVTATNGSAEILDLDDARAMRLGVGNAAGEYRHVGVFLAAEREAQGLTLAEAAAKTHIKENHLAAMEEVDMTALPARPYAIGFVKTYAEFLDLDAVQAVARFKEDAGYDAPPKVEVEKFEAAEAAAEKEQRDLSLWAIAGVMVFILWCAWQITLPQEVTRLGADNSIETPPAPALPDPALQTPVSEIIEARVVEEIEPVYPRGCETAAQAVETVTVSFTITNAGRVSGERIAQSSNACFNDAALNAMRRWRFEPRTVDGAPRAAFDQKMSFSFQRPQ